MTRKTVVPSHLRPATKAFWLETKAKYEMEQHHDHLFLLACEALDRAAQAREILAGEGVTVRDDRGNLRPHPLLTVERDCRTAVARLFRELDLDADVPRSSPRPPALHSNRRQ